MFPLHGETFPPRAFIPSLSFDKLRMERGGELNEQQANLLHGERDP